MHDSFHSKSTLDIDGRSFELFRLSAVARRFAGVDRLPYALKIVLENLLRMEDGHTVQAGDIEAVATWRATAAPSRDIAFTPNRVLHQDFTGVPALVDLAAMRDAMQRLGGDPDDINAIQPVDFVVDHSVQVDEHGRADAARKNGELEFIRNRERYRFLRWGESAFDNCRVVPPQIGIIHQVNIEYLAHVVFTDRRGSPPTVYPDTVVGTDSHTTMVNSLGVLGWGCGGIEAEAVMLGEPLSLLIPHVIGVQLTGRLSAGATATDLVLTITEMLRKHNVVGTFVEFFGDGLPSLSLADRATVANMAPEYGATCGIFPIDDETLRYLRLTGRSPAHVHLVAAYAKEQGLFHVPERWAARYTDVLTLDLGTVEACLAGPTRPQDRIPLGAMNHAFLESVPVLGGTKAADRDDSAPLMDIVAADAVHEIRDGSVVIAAITSCTNTSNPALLFAAGLLAKNAIERGLSTKPWVKTSFAPGSRVATAYLTHTGLMSCLEQLGFFLVGYGCTTCVGNSGPLRVSITDAIHTRGLVVASVLSGNRNFEGRIHPDVRANYLASPPLVVAYALAGRMDIDLTCDPLGEDERGEPVYLRDIWPTREQIADAIERGLRPEMYAKVYGQAFTGSARWQALEAPSQAMYEWPAASTYIRKPPYFADMTAALPPVRPIEGARVLALLGDSITTDHISPAGAIQKDSPAGRYLLEQGVAPRDFNAYGARRGNHEVMMRGAFANVRLKNQLTPGVEGGVTRHFPGGQTMTIFEASMRYQRDRVPLLVIGGEQYGTGSSRDWAAKGPCLLGVRAVLAQSFERIHRSNLIGMGIAPLQFSPGENAATLGLSGTERYDIVGLVEAATSGFATGRKLTVRAVRERGITREFCVTVRIDTPREALYYQHGGILHYIIRQLLQPERGDS